MSSMDRQLLEEMYSAAVSAVEPGRALATTLESERVEPAGGTWIIALGKAAHPLAKAAVRWLAGHGMEPAGGVIVSHESRDPPHAGLLGVTGDHPLPGPASLHAAEVLESVVRRIPPTDEVWVLISGGTTSLLAAPVRGINADDMRETYDVLLRSGLDIHDMNRVRKRISRWGGGRLAVALAHVTTRTFILSDVMGNDIASIGSGPCSPDTTTAARLRAQLTAEGLLSRLPPSIADFLERTERRMLPETPKPDEPAFRTVREYLIGSNRLAIAAGARHAEAAGMIVRHKRTPLLGDAADMGSRIAERMVREGLESTGPATCYVCGGETTVTLGSGAGTGGRCQELALAAARVIDGLQEARITLLAAGTDGRDGPTDAAGAIVDNDTWSAIERAGRNPDADLERHDSWPALDAAGALFRTGATGTNVNDVVFIIVRPES